MDALILRIAIGLAALGSLGATRQTPNFIVHAPTAEIAQQVGEAAEHYRRELAVEWLGRAMPRWYHPCPIQVNVGQTGAGGATSFSFDKGEVFGWKMNVQGPLDRILDSVLPHEVSHTIFACHFRKPLPRWADEGAATLAEDESEKARQRRLVEQVLHNSRRIPLRQLFEIREYPSDMQKVLTLYAEGYSLADFLVQQGGKAKYLAFLHDALENGWDQSLKKHYEHVNVDQLEKRWSSWVTAGCPSLKLPDGQQLAEGNAPAMENASPIPNETASPETVVRGQSPDARFAGRQRSAAFPAPRGRGLSAPSPHTRGNQPVAIDLGQATEFPTEPATATVSQNVTNAGSKTESIATGWMRALNAGWIPAEPAQPACRSVRRPRPSFGGKGELPVTATSALPGAHGAASRTADIQTAAQNDDGRAWSQFPQASRDSATRRRGAVELESTSLSSTIP